MTGSAHEEHVPSTERSNVPPIHLRLAIALVVAVFAGVITYVTLTAHPALGARDFTWHWRAARILLDGQNPYELIKPVGYYPYNYGYFYPLSAAVLVLPFALLQVIPAGILFIAVTSFLLAFVATRSGYHRLPMFLSMPFVWSCYLVQMAPLLTAAVLAPVLSGAMCVKPNLGLTVLAYRPRLRYAFIGSAVLLAVAFIFVPSWPMDWIRVVTERPSGFYRSPVTLRGGLLLLVAIIRWRQPEARLLLVMSLIPQNFTFVDQLPLWLVARTFKESLVLAMLSWLGLGAIRLILPESIAPVNAMLVTGPVQVVICYMPCLIMVLRRPNEGELPEWMKPLERFAIGRRLISAR
jgi:hypothetical protein